MDKNTLEDVLEEFMDIREYHTSELYRSGNAQFFSARNTSTGRALAIRVLRHPNSKFQLWRMYRIWSVVNSPVPTSSDRGLRVFSPFVAYTATRDFLATVCYRCDVSLAVYMQWPTSLPLIRGHVCSIAYQVLSGLQHLHAEGIVHTNLSSSSIVLVNPGSLIYTDFMKGSFVKKRILESPMINITSYEDAADFKYGLSPRNLTIGTPGYRAPEIMFALPWSAGIDIFAFGCLVAEMHLGRMLMPVNPNPSAYMTALEDLLGRSSSAFVFQIRRTGYSSMYSRTGYLIRDATPGALERVSLKALIKQSDLTDFLRVCLCADGSTRALACALLKHRYIVG